MWEYGSIEHNNDWLMHAKRDSKLKFNTAKKTQDDSAPRQQEEVSKKLIKKKTNSNIIRDKKPGGPAISSKAKTFVSKLLSKKVHK
nr:MAG TPA: hypothetical protein [Caudoviricetes sp.]